MPDPVNCKVEPPTVILCAPVIVGTALIVTVMAVRGLSHGLEIDVPVSVKNKSNAVFDVFPLYALPVIIFATGFIK